MTFAGFISQLLEIVIAVALAPLLTGWVNQWRAWFQNKTAPSLWQPYRMLHKLFNKESIVADHASRLFRIAPYVMFGCMVLACAIIPTLSTYLPLAPAADAIALVGLFALARVFISLAAMDIGTAFGTMGARREMLFGFLAEPALLMVLFSASLISQSTSLATIVETLAHRELAIYPGLAFAGVAFTMVSLAENARVPVDNPATHLELTMIHEVMVLDHGGPDLAFILYGASVKLLLFAAVFVRIAMPTATDSPTTALLVGVAGIALVGIVIGCVESCMARLRLSRIPVLVGGALVLSTVAIAVHFATRGAR